MCVCVCVYTDPLRNVCGHLRNGRDEQRQIRSVRVQGHHAVAVEAGQSAAKGLADPARVHHRAPIRDRSVRTHQIVRQII